jgi:hypothetical protein
LMSIGPGPMDQSTLTNMIISTTVRGLSLLRFKAIIDRLSFHSGVLRDVVLDNTRSISYIPSSTTQGCVFFLQFSTMFS